MEGKISWPMVAAALRRAGPLIARAVLVGLVTALGLAGTLPRPVVDACRDALVAPLGLFGL